MSKLCRQETDKCIYYYIKDNAGKLVTTGMLCKGQQVETGQPILEQSTSMKIFDDVFSSWEMVNGEIIGVEK